MSGGSGFTDAELDRLIADHGNTLETAAAARERQAGLVNSAEFRAKYAAGDPAAIGLFNRLSELRAAGYGVFKDAQTAMVGDPGGNLGQGGIVGGVGGTSVSVNKLIGDAVFRERYFAGDREAVAKWNEATGVTGAQQQATTGETQTEGQGQ